MQQWQVVNSNTDRMKVPGGWLVRSYLIRTESLVAPTKVVGGKPQTIIYDKNPTNVALCFVPDPDHSWVVEAGGSEVAGQN